MNSMKQIVLSFVLTVLFLCSCGSNGSQRPITAEMAYEGVNNYCHSAFDWSIAKDNPSIMYVQMGEETDSAYFYVDKTSGKTKMVEYVPGLDIKSEAGTIDLFDYMK